MSVKNSGESDLQGNPGDPGRAVGADTSAPQSAACGASARASTSFLLDCVSDSAIEVDPDGIIRSWNAAAVRIFGYRPDQMIGQPFGKLNVRQHTAAFSQRLAVALSGASVGPVECSRVARNGSILRVESRMRRVPYSMENAPRVLIIDRDVTREREITQALNDKEREISAMLDAASDGVITINSHGRIMTFNRAAERIFKYPAEMVIGQNVSMLMPEPYQSEHGDYLRRFLSTGRAAIIGRGREVLGLRRDGSTFPMNLAINVYKVNGEYRFTGVLRDVSSNQDSRELERQHREIIDRYHTDVEFLRTALDGQREELEAMSQFHAEAEERAAIAVRAKSDFLANMSHEIRTPMTAILGFSENLLSPEMSESERFETIEIIQKNGEYLLNILDDILDLSKLDGGRLEVQRVDTRVRDIVEDVLNMMRVRANSKGLHLESSYLGEIPPVLQSDPVRLRQILINLIANGVKFTELGFVRVEVSMLEASPENVIQFDIVDSGIGIAPEHAESLFLEFSQADSSMARRYGGAGLGLVVSRRLARVMGGDVVLADTAPDKGSRFRLTLPQVASPGEDVVAAGGDLRNASYSAEEMATPAVMATRLACRILVAEDGLDNQRLIRHILTKAGAEVVLAGNGEIAIERLDEATAAGAPFDLIVMDMQMPVMSGYEAASELRRRGETIPIVALTAHALPEDRQKCLDAGCDDYATKPIDRNAFLSKLAVMLATKRADRMLTGAK